MRILLSNFNSITYIKTKANPSLKITKTEKQSRPWLSNKAYAISDAKWIVNKFLYSLQSLTKYLPAVLSYYILNT